MMSIVPFQTATLDTVEDVVKSKLDWMAITKPGVYVAKELGDYMEIDAVELYAALQGEEECHNLREKIVAGNDIRFDAITNANGVMIVWKKLMDQPRFYREVERFMAARRKKSQPGRRRRYMAVAEDVSDADEDEFPFDAEVPSKEPHRDDRADDHDRLCMMDGEIERYEGPEEKRIETPLVCSGIHPQSKPSLHLEVELNGKRVSALIDTGATNCFVHLRTLKALGLGKDVRSCERSVTLGNGTSAPLAGRVSLKATIGGEAYPIDAFVLAGKGPALNLGYRFLQENNLIIDCRARKLLRARQTPLQCYHGEMQSTVDASGRGANLKLSAKKQLEGRLDTGRNEMQDLMCEMWALTAQISALTVCCKKKRGSVIVGSSSTVNAIHMLERPLYLLYRKNGRVVVPFNRSCVLGPGEKRKLILSIFFPPGTLLTVEREVRDLLTVEYGITASQVRFSPQTNGTRVWGILENCSAVPRHLTHRMVLCLIRSTVTLENC